ncbi:hypothetical protein JTY60_01160 [symbiont of Argiope bruennichi]|uniref:hypothetical protein n=1 Tax=symbiont of Argiope bruennichi TaxID=2810479 RepID=UPI003DA58AD9
MNIIALVTTCIFIVILIFALYRLYYDNLLSFFQVKKIFPISFEINYEKKTLKFFQENIFFQSGTRYFYDSFFNILISRNYFLLKFIFSNIENLYEKYNFILIELIDKYGNDHKFELNFIFTDTNKKKVYCTLIPVNKITSFKKKYLNIFLKKEINQKKYLLSKVDFLLKINHIIIKKKLSKNFYFFTLSINKNYQEVAFENVFFEEKVNYILSLFYKLFLSRIYIAKFEKNTYKMFSYGLSLKKILKIMKLVEKKLNGYFFKFNFFSIYVGIYYPEKNKSIDVSDFFNNSEFAAILAKKNKTLFVVYNLQDKSVAGKYFQIEKKILEEQDFSLDNLIVDQKGNTLGFLYDHIYMAGEKKVKKFFSDYLNIFFQNDEFKLKYDRKFFSNILLKTKKIKSELALKKAYVFFSLCYGTFFEVDNLLKIFKMYEKENIVPVLQIDKNFYLSPLFIDAINKLKKNSFEICFVTGKIDPIRYNLILKIHPKFVLIRKSYVDNAINNFNTFNQLIFFANFCKDNKIHLIISTDQKNNYAKYFFDKKINCNYYKIKKSLSVS